LEVLVGGEESKELWHLDGFETTGLVDIEMSPGLGEVGTKIGIEIGTADFLVGAEDFLSASGGLIFINGTTGGVVGEDGSHEKIIIISGESLGIWDWDENVLFIFFVIGGVGGGVIELDVGSHWWSVVGSVGRDITVVVLEDLLVSVGENGLKLPNTGGVFGGDESEEGGDSDGSHCLLISNLLLFNLNSIAEH
jgi:hypothetical protein